MDSRHMDTLWALDWRVLRRQGDGPLNSFLLPLPLVEATRPALNRALPLTLSSPASAVSPAREAPLRLDTDKKDPV